LLDASENVDANAAAAAADVYDDVLIFPNDRLLLIDLRKEKKERRGREREKKEERRRGRKVSPFCYHNANVCSNKRGKQ